LQFKDKFFKVLKNFLQDKFQFLKIKNFKLLIPCTNINFLSSQLYTPYKLAPSQHGDDGWYAHGMVR
jgi:hypothetical protein